MVCRCHWVFMFLYFHFQVAVKRLSETLVLLRHQIIQTTILCLWIACMLFASPTAVLSHLPSHTLTWSPQKVRVKWHFFVFVSYTTDIEQKNTFKSLYILRQFFSQLVLSRFYFACFSWKILSGFIVAHSGCVYDHIEVFDGSASTASSLGKFCGNTKPALIRSTSNELLLKFHSDQSIARPGFVASYTAESPGKSE